MTNTMTHISLLVEDVQKALHFYQDNLGLEVIENLGNYATLKANENLKLSFFPRIAMPFPTTVSSNEQDRELPLSYTRDHQENNCNN